MPTPAFLVGYNEAWFGGHYGTDLTTHYDRAFVEDTLDGVRAAGGRVVRLWLFELMQGVPLGATPPQTGPVSPVMLAHLDEVLTAARRRALWVYVTALDGNALPEQPGAMRDYYANLLNDRAGEEQAFDALALAPVLDVLAAHRDVVWGLDLMNEIAAPRARGYWADRIDGPRGWMQRTAAFVHRHSPWLRVTVSAGWGNAQYDLSLGTFSGLGLDFYDLHVYSDDGTYAGQTDVCQRAARDGVPVILGEFGQRAHTDDDALQARVTAEFLQRARASCFSAALAWRYDATEPWLAYTRPDGSHRPAVAWIQAFSGP